MKKSRNSLLGNSRRANETKKEREKNIHSDQPASKNGGASASPQPSKTPVLTVLLLVAQFKTHYW
jgi:hypothetical protein